MKRNYFRIELSDDATALCNVLVSLAAKSNGGEVKYTLEQMKTVADGNLIEYPNANKDTTCEIIGDTILHIDRKIGDNYKTVCRIEQVEIVETAKVVDFESEDDIPENLYTHAGLGDN